jgi:lysozyme family protein
MRELANFERQKLIRIVKKIETFSRELDANGKPEWAERVLYAVIALSPAFEKEFYRELHSKEPTSSWHDAVIDKLRSVFEFGVRMQDTSQRLQRLQRNPKPRSSV